MERFKALTRTTTVEIWSSSDYDERLYHCHAEGGRVAVVITYVDDIAFPGIYIGEIKRMRTSSASTYKRRDVGVYSLSESSQSTAISPSTNGFTPEVSSKREWVR